MGRVKEVKEILQTLSFFVVVQVNGDKGQKSPGFPQKTDATGNGFFQGIGIKEIEDDDEQDTLLIIIPMEDRAYTQAAESRKEEEGRADRSDLLHRPDGEKTNEQSEHDILIGYFQEAVIKSQVKGNLGQQSK